MSDLIKIIIDVIDLILAGEIDPMEDSVESRLRKIRQEAERLIDGYR